MSRKTLIGQKFGRLTVIGEASDYIQPNGRKRPRVLCRCECGNEKTIMVSNLKRPNSTLSCGCYHKDIMKNLIIERKYNDINGHKFGFLTVKKLVGDYISPHSKKEKQWLCVCVCGKEIVVRGSALRSGHIKSCGCQKKELISRAGLIDLIGQRFGRLVVLERVENYVSPKGHPLVRWLCQCDCGNYSCPTSSVLIKGETNSCGCLNRDRITGANNVNWKGGTTSLRQSIVQLSKYRDWYKCVLIRDNYRCRYSGSGKDLNIHHIKSFSRIIDEKKITNIQDALLCEELWDVNNGISLSEEFHLGIKNSNPYSFHRAYGTRSATPEDFAVWFLAMTPDTEGSYRNRGLV